MMHAVVRQLMRVWTSGGGEVCIVSRDGDDNTARKNNLPAATFVSIILKVTPANPLCKQRLPDALGTE